jgi:hypothetical protein
VRPRRLDEQKHRVIFAGSGKSSVDLVGGDAPERIAIMWTIQLDCRDAVGDWRTVTSAHAVR